MNMKMARKLSEANSRKWHYVEEARLAAEALEQVLLIGQKLLAFARGEEEDE